MKNQLKEKNNNHKRNDSSFNKQNTNINSFNNKHIGNDKNNYTYKPQIQLKTLYPFIKGIPPSSNWSNHFTSIFFWNKKYLLYISNSFIVVINLEKKIFAQILSSNKITPKDKPNVLLGLNDEKFLTITNSGEIIIFYINNENNFIEDLSINKIHKIIKTVKCILYNKQLKVLILSNEVKIYIYYFEFEKGINIYKIYEIDNINNDEYMITDMIIIDSNDSNCYLFVCNNIGNIILYNIDRIKYSQIFVIRDKKENIFNICYDSINNLLCSINKSGTLNIYKIIMDSENNEKIEYNKIITLNNKFNDQSINEFYLYFSISFLYNKENNNNYILATSNQGRIFIYDIKNNDFKEIAENPHKNCIYSILLNYDLNQIIFFSSDYKISLFNLIYSKTFEPSLNFLYCINTIPSKTKIFNQINNKIYYLYQIQHSLFINSYNIKKDKNFLETLQNRIKIFNNKNIKNINKDNSRYNYNINLCHLINEEKILLVNKMNEVIIYNLESEIKENNFSFLSSDYLIIDIMLYENCLYILYKQGLIIIFNLFSEKIEKYKITNSIDKGYLTYIRNGFIVVAVNEEKTNIIKFFLIKNYFLIQLYNFNYNITNNFFSHRIILPDDNFYYIYSDNDNLNIFYINIHKQMEILNDDIKFKDINHKEYLKIIDDLNESITSISKEKYIFNEIFLRNDVNKNNFKMTNMAFNEKNNNLICSFSDGSVMLYIIDIDKKVKYCHIINKITYKYLIKSHYLSIINSIFLDNTVKNEEEEEVYNSTLFASTSSEQSIKIIDVSNCNLLNLYFFPEKEQTKGNNKTSINNKIINSQINLNNYVINKSFTNLFSNYFFTQSYKEAKKFSEIFNLTEDINNSSLEQLIFSYYVDNKEKNLLTIQKVIEYANEKNNNKKQHSLYIEKICDFFTNKENKKNSEYKTIFEIEKDKNIIIQILINGFCYVESLLYIKYMSFGLEEFIQCLEKIKKSIYSKQLFQVTKIEKIIQYYKNVLNKY